MDELKDGRAWGFCAPVLLRKKEKRCKFNVSPTFTNAADRNRTGTGITTHGILSPGRLPVPPLRHMEPIGQRWKCSNAWS